MLQVVVSDLVPVLNGVQGVAGSNPAPGVLDRLTTALADRYAIEHERAGGMALPKGLKSQPSHHVGKRCDAVMWVFVPYVKANSYPVLP